MSGVARPSASAHACQACYSAKTKCILDGTMPNGPCTRCSRLKKTCVAKAPVVRRKRIAGKTRTAQLAERLEELEAMLSDQQQPRPVSNAVVPPTPSTAVSASSFNDTSSTPISGVMPELAIRAPPQVQHQQSTRRLTRPKPGAPFPDFIVALRQPPLPCVGFSAVVEPSSAEAEELLFRYRRMYAPRCPYVVIEENTTAEELRMQRPHVFRSVIMVATLGTTFKQLQRAKEILMGFVNNLALAGERSMDLLQGMIIFMNWHVYQMSICSEMTQHLQMMLGLMFDLGISRSRVCDLEEIVTYPLMNNNQKLDQPVSVLDEQRAYLGCFVLSSIVALNYRRTLSLHYLPYNQICLDALSGVHSSERDQGLVNTVRIQSFIVRVDSIFSRAELDDTSRTPVAMHVKNFQQQLKELRDSLPAPALNDSFTMMHLYAAEARIYEIGVYKNAFPPDGSTSQSDGLSRIDILYCCLEACHKLLKMTMDLTTDQMTTTCLTDNGNFITAVALSMRLLTLDAPGWDLRQVRRAYDLSAVFNDFQQKAEEISFQHDPQRICNGTDIFGLMRRKMMLMKAWCDAKFKVDEPIQPLHEAMPTTMDIPDLDLPMDFLDEEFLNESLNLDEFMEWMSKNQ